MVSYNFFLLNISCKYPNLPIPAGSAPFFPWAPSAEQKTSAVIGEKAAIFNWEGKGGPGYVFHMPKHSIRSIYAIVSPFPPFLLNIQKLKCPFYNLICNNNTLPDQLYSRDVWNIFLLAQAIPYKKKNRGDGIIISKSWASRP